MNRRVSYGNRGASLLEVLAYAFLLLVVINLCAGVFVRSSRLATLGAKMLDTARAMDEAQMDFADAVRAASGVVDSVGSYRSGPDQVILRLPPDSEEPGVWRYAIFGALSDKTRLTRLVLAQRNGELVADAMESYPVAFDAIQFDYAKAVPEDAALVTLRLELNATDARRQPGPQVVTAALRNRHVQKEGGA